MTEPFDYDGLTAHIRAIRTHDDAYDALRERIEAAFVPKEWRDCQVNAGRQLRAEATARAEAAEARVKALEAALGDLLSWFPQKPSPPEWRLRAGERGADDAVEAARAALGGEHDK